MDVAVRKPSAGPRVWNFSRIAQRLHCGGFTLGTLPGETSAGSTDGFVVKLSALIPSELIHELITDVMALNLKQGVENSLEPSLTLPSEPWTT